MLGFWEALKLYIVHAVTCLKEDPKVKLNDNWTLLLDFSFAFILSISHGKMLEEVRAQNSSMAAWLVYYYVSQPLLHFRNRTIYSCCQVQQGDPLGHLGFAFSFHVIVKKIKREVPDLKINAWYLDDGIFCGSASDLCLALTVIEEEGCAIELHFNQ